VKADVKTLGDALVKVECFGEAGQTTRAQATRIAKNVDKLGETPLHTLTDMLKEVDLRHLASHSLTKKQA